MCICPPSGEVPIRVVELGVPREEHAGEELLHLQLDEERDGDEVVVDHHPGQEVAEPGGKGPGVVDAQVPVVGEVGPPLVALGRDSIHLIKIVIRLMKACSKCCQRSHSQPYQHV